MLRIAFLILSSLLLLSCNEKKTIISKLPYYNDPAFTPVFINNEEEIQKKINHTIGDFSLLDQDSNLFDQNKINGRIHVASFIFTSCGSICPSMIRNMKTLADSLKNDTSLLFLSYSVTPWIDKPFVLKRYKEHHNINNSNWYFITGQKGAIYNLARRSYFAEEDIGFTRDSSEFLHTEHFILVDATRKIRGIYNGTLQLEMLQLLDDIKTLQQEE